MNKNSVQIQIAKQLPITLGSKISIDDHSVVIHEAIMCGGVTTIRGYLGNKNQMNIDNLATQTPEEKEVLDLIDTTPHQYEVSKFSGEPEWKNGDELDWLTPDNKWCMCEHLFIGKHSSGSPVIEHKTTGNMFETYWCAIRKPETPMTEREAFVEDMYHAAQLGDCISFTKGMAGVLFDSGKFKLVESNQ